MSKFSFQNFMLLCFLLFSALSVQAQEDSLLRWADKAGSFATRYPQEKVFVQMDNTSYYLGDTLYFKAYVSRSDLGLPSNISQVLYAELLNEDGYLVERQLIELKEGQGHGSFCLPDTAYAGYYELRAYTRWQLNWGLSERPHSYRCGYWFLRKSFEKEFYRDYDKLYSRVFPVYDKPRVSGHYDRMMTRRPLQRDYGESEGAPHVTFYPEGGSWVSGVRQRMAFEASDSEGRHLNGEVVLLNIRGDTLAVASTEHGGRGLLTILPEWGTRLRASFREPGGRILQTALPKSVSQGVSMEVVPASSQLEVNVQSVGMESSRLALVVLQQGRRRYCSEIAGGRVLVPLDSLSSGVSDFTVYDVSGRVWSSRLFFVWKDDLHPQGITFDGLPDRCDSLQRVSFRVKSSRQSVLSVSVRDRDTSDPTYDSGNILTEMLLGSELKGFVENPAYYFESRDSVHMRALDLLLMVQGWRRYEWKSLTGGFRTLQPFEKTPLLMGEVYRYSPLDQEDVFISETLEQNDLESYRGGVGPLLVEQIIENDSWTRELDRMKEVALKYFDKHEMEMESEREKRINGGRKEKKETNENDPFEFGSGIEKKSDKFIYNSSLDNPLLQSLSVLTDSVRVLAQFSRGKKFLLDSECLTKDRFLLPMPVTYGPYNLHLGAYEKNQKKYKEGKNKKQREYPDYSIRMVDFHPRWVKPYTYYQCNEVASSPDGKEVSRKGAPLRIGDTEEMAELTVRQKIRGRRAIDYSKPAYVTDAYRLFNETVDAGLLTAYFSGYRSFALQSTRMLIGDTGTGRGYHLKRRWNGKTTSLFPQIEQQEYNHLKNLHRVVLYTDFAPRRRGDSRYAASNQPDVLYNLEKFEDNTIRPAFRTRYYQMQGFSSCEEFYNPDYSRRPLPSGVKDCRRTLYWNPNLQLNEQGEAQIEFYAPSKETYLTVEANGRATDGTLLTGRKE